VRDVFERLRMRLRRMLVAMCLYVRAVGGEQLAL
jgi:hypothetical protein